MERADIEDIFYGHPDQQRRFTQDFPVLPDVWIKYGTKPGKRFELLLTPHSRTDAATVAQALRQRLAQEQKVDLGGMICKLVLAGEKPPRILFNESVVLANFSFWELMRVAMPLTDWWRRAVAPLGNDWSRESVTKDRDLDVLLIWRRSDPNEVEQLSNEKEGHRTAH